MLSVSTSIDYPFVNFGSYRIEENSQETRGKEESNKGLKT